MTILEIYFGHIFKLIFLTMKHFKVYQTEVDFLNNKDTHKYPTIAYIKESKSCDWTLQKPLFDWVDLGLPSGLRWAAWNVGATKPEEIGLYFAWGETQGYTGITDEKQFSWDDYEYSVDAKGTSMSKYNNTDNLLSLEEKDDVGQELNYKYFIPSRDDVLELINNTTTAWTQVNGVSGCRFTSNVNGNSIFRLVIIFAPQS